ncbi:uncharacterized protein LOC127873039 isoform X2 [Dreissena polymorpha]|uniref:uncharacterized protein LOC127873039 isoform X2 n=1 Tax=Dreissena polymorpha TaxID=45954 RepID=UPI0022652631|nr:uncharacterized protein LOC127873039 isoform X2 [Dreissena polymorpha]
MFTSKTEHLAVALIVFVFVCTMQFAHAAYVPEVACVQTCQKFKDEKFDNYCHKYGSCDWYCAAQRMNCSAPYTYHCARAFGYLENQFFNVCAIPIRCKKGEEPFINMTNTPAEVKCIPCVNKDYYNDNDQLMSSTFSKCSHMKVNKCTKENYKIDCGLEHGNKAWNVQTETDGFCRCDARAGYEPKYKDVFHIKGGYCFYEKVECVKKECPGMEVSLNYECMPRCPDGQGRNQLSDVCTDLIPPTIFTTTNGTTNIVLSSQQEKDSTLATSPPATQTFEGDKKYEYLHTFIKVIGVVVVSVGVVIAGYCCFKTWKRQRKKNGGRWLKKWMREKKEEEGRSQNKNNTDENLEMGTRTDSKKSDSQTLEKNTKTVHKTTETNINGDKIEIIGGETHFHLYQSDPRITSGGAHNIDDIIDKTKITECPTPPLLRDLASSKGSFQNIPSNEGASPKQDRKWQSHGKTEREESVISQPSDAPEDDIPFCDDPPEERIPLLTTTSTITHGIEKTLKFGTMRQDLQLKITKNLQAIKKDIDAKDLLDIFIEKNVFDFKDKDEIEGWNPNTQENRNNCFIRKILQKGDNAYTVFIDALKAHGFQHLVDLLESNLVDPLNQDNGLKPVGLTEEPETDCDDGVISDDEKEKFAENFLNGVLHSFKDSNDSNLATIESILDKMTEKEKVKLYLMFKFPEREIKTPEIFQNDFTCKNCGKNFIRGNSSGKNNSCMYQSISKLLCGDERLQNRLRLCSTLHAVEWFNYYVKQMEAFAGKENSPPMRVLQILGQADIAPHEIEDWKVSLRKGIKEIVVQTSELTRDSCQLHIMFLSHALGCKITQHFEDSNHHEDTEDCPVLEKDTANTLGILDLHILWNKDRNHLMPLFKK